MDAGSLPAERAPSRYPGAAALQACYLKSLELDENYAIAWYNLAVVVGGGTVKGRAYGKKDGGREVGVGVRACQSRVCSCPLIRSIAAAPEAD